MATDRAKVTVTLTLDQANLVSELLESEVQRIDSLRGMDRDRAAKRKVLTLGTKERF